MKAEDLARLGFVVRPAMPGSKAPGDDATVEGLTPEQIESRRLVGDPERYCVVLGRTDIGPRSGVIDVETDIDKATGEMVGEAALAAAGIEMPPGPWMQTPSGSKHRLLRVDVPEGQEVSFGPGLLPKVDVPWQFLAVDDGRTWHDTHLPIPAAPEALLGRVLRPKTARNAAPPSDPYEGDGYGDPRAVAQVETLIGRYKDLPWEGHGWNETFRKAVRLAAGLVAGGLLDHTWAEEALLGACDQPEEALAVFSSTWKDGYALPITRLRVDGTAEERNGSVEEDETDQWDPSWHPLAVQRSATASRTRRRIVSEEIAAAWTLGRADLEALPEPEFLVEGRLQTNSFAQLAGPSGVGKSFVALGWALDMTSAPAAPRRVLYLAAEGVTGYLRRIEAWEESTGRRWDDTRLRLRADVPPLLGLEDLDHYVSLIRGTGPWDLVVVDTLSRAIAGANENAAEIMSAAVEGAQRLQKAADGTILLVHHFGWEGSRQRGSNSLYAACDNVVYVKGGEGGTLVVSTDKLKDGEPTDEERFRLTPCRRSCVLQSVASDDVAVRKDRIKQKIRDLRAANPTANKTTILGKFDNEARKVAREVWDSVAAESLTEPDYTLDEVLG